MDFGNKIWQKPITQNESPSFRAAHSCDKIGKSLYVFGGWNGKRALNDLHCLDIETMIWNQPETIGTIPAKRNNHTTAVVGSKIFLHGGHDGSNWMDDLHILNTSNNVSMSWKTPQVSGQMPSARACHTLSRVGGKLYMFGGYDGVQCFNEVDILDLDTMTWIKPPITEGIPMARNAHTMTVFGTNLYLFGGHSGNKHLTDLHVFDTVCLNWTEMKTKGSPPKGLRGHTGSLVGSKIYLFGGYDGKGSIRSNDLYILDLHKLHWCHPPESEETPSGRQRHTASVVGSKEIIIFGGFDGNRWLNDLYKLDVGRLESYEITSGAVGKLLSDLHRLLNDKAFYDIVFIVDSKPLYAHKGINSGILSERSEHFKAMFMSGMKETTQTQIEITDWSYESYLFMLEFLYTAGISNFTPMVAQELIGLADAYQIQDLKSLCENCLIHNVENDNVCDLLIISSACSANDLKKFCISYVVKNFQDISNTKGFENLEHHASLLMEVTKAVCSASNNPQMRDYS